MGESLLVLDSGGRGHAITRAVYGASDLDQIYCAPGNAGTHQDLMGMRVKNLNFGPGDTRAILDFAEEHRSGLTVVVGPEGPLVAGLGDQLRERKINTFGPNANAAKLEGSKIFATEFMQRYGIPHPDSFVTDSLTLAREHARYRRPEDLVIKADGLAGGKGVVLPDTAIELDNALIDMLMFGGYDRAGEKGVVIQERLTGPELSVFVVSDGKGGYSVIPYFAQDHKRLGEGDTGPNTGGMGAYTPFPAEKINDDQLAKIEEIAAKTIAGMEQDGTPYQGVLYMGLMLANERNGSPVVIEYNCRFGDPETQVLLPTLARAGFDVYGMLRDTARGKVPDLGAPRFAGNAAVTVCLAAAGYPDPHRVEKGQVIRGLDQTYDGVIIHHGNTVRQGGDTLTTGGRPLYVTGLDKDVRAAANRAYTAIGAPDGGGGIWFPNMQVRRDIAKFALGH